MESVRTSKIRWLMLGCYCGLDFLNGLSWTTLIPISSQASSYFSVSENYITLYESVFFLLFVGLAPINWWILSRNFYWANLTAWILCFIGVWLKFISGTSFWLSFLGQSLTASVGSMVVPGCGALVASYFPHQEHLLATSISSLSNFMGIGIGMILPLYISIPNVMLTQAVYTTIFTSIYILAAEPSLRSTGNSVSFLESWKFVAGDLNFCKIVLCSSGSMGVVYTVLGLFGSIFYRGGYTNIFISWLGLGFVAAALIGAIMASMWERKYFNINGPLKLMLGLSVANLTCWAMFFSKPEICVMFCVMTGACMIGCIPLQLQLSIRYSRRIPESVPVNIIYFCAEFLSIVFTLGFGVLEACSEGTGMWMLVGIICVVGIAVMMKRSEAKKENEIKLLV